jgi:uncharacterized protein YqgV (UPF0045/DUF77 family)
MSSIKLSSHIIYPFLLLKLYEAKAPLQQKFRSKELEKKRLRASVSQALQRLQDALNKFQTDTRHLKELNNLIAQYVSSDKPMETTRIEAQVSEILKAIEVQKTRCDEEREKLNALNATVNDQARQRRQIEMNLELLDNEARVLTLKGEVEQLMKQKNAIEGSDTADEDHAKLKKRLEDLGAKKARIEGRWGEIVEQIRSLKVSYNVFTLEITLNQSHMYGLSEETRFA